MTQEHELLIVGVNGSPRHGATEKAVRICLEAAAEVPGVRTEMINLAGRRINACVNCNACLKRDLGHCAVFEDGFEQRFLELYGQCDGLILGSAIYQMNPTGLLTNFVSRLRPLGKVTRSGIFDMRIGGSIAVGGMRNGGQDLTLSALNATLQTLSVNIVGGGVHFYNGAAVWSKNEMDFDDWKGTLELEIMGRKIAYAAKAIRAGMEALGDTVSNANYAGFRSEEHMAESYRRIGL